MTASPTTRRGFTLVEVLATLMLAAIVLPVVMRGISACLTTSGLARRQAEAAALAQDKLSELVALGELQQALQGGDCGADWPDYRWEASLSDYDGATLQQLDVTVSWFPSGTQRGPQRSVTLTSLVYSGSASDTSTTTGTGTGTSSGTGAKTGTGTGAGTGSGGTTR